MAKKTWAEKWGESPVDYTMSTEDLRKTLRKVTNLTKRRIATLSKQRVPSYAAYQFQLEELPKTSINKMNRFQLAHEIARYHHFWESETSTVAGARKVALEQDKRIFGVTGKGRPRKQMTFDERVKYWAIYDEFFRQYKDTARFDSTRIQQLMGEEMNNFDLSTVDWIPFMDQIRTRLEEEYEEGSWGDRYNDDPVNWIGSRHD